MKNHQHKLLKHNNEYKTDEFLYDRNIKNAILIMNELDKEHNDSNYLLLKTEALKVSKLIIKYYISPGIGYTDLQKEHDMIIENYNHRRNKNFHDFNIECLKYNYHLSKKDVLGSFSIFVDSINNVNVKKFLTEKKYNG